MVSATGFESLDALIDATVPEAIRRHDRMDLGKYSDGLTESDFLASFKCCSPPLHASTHALHGDVRHDVCSNMVAASARCNPAMRAACQCTRHDSACIRT